MSAELVVMTDEWVGDRFKVYRAPLDAIDDTPRSGILFIVISCEDDVKPRLNGRRRLCEVHGRDWYTLIVRSKNVLLAGWDDGDFVWHGLPDPWAESSRTIPDHLPMARSITFKGAWIEPEKWKKALEQYNAEIH